ncbi:type II toxin-antitoxin system YoeB family toxin [Nicoletella semolina]|nr:type II toxin-antitoxin system YoeB family toxin [Nicoletella semolina]
MSRGINKEQHLIYSVQEQSILIVSCRYHYEQ